MTTTKFGWSINTRLVQVDEFGRRLVGSDINYCNPYDHMIQFERLRNILYPHTTLNLLFPWNINILSIFYVLGYYLCSNPGYLHSKDGGSLTMSLTGKFLYIWLIISPCYDSILLTLGLIGRDGGLSTLCYGCGFACQ